jgi:hypothetical protein
MIRSIWCLRVATAARLIARRPGEKGNHGTAEVNGRNAAGIPLGGRDPPSRSGDGIGLPVRIDFSRVICEAFDGPEWEASMRKTAWIVAMMLVATSACSGSEDGTTDTGFDPGAPDMGTDPGEAPDVGRDFGDDPGAEDPGEPADPGVEDPGIDTFDETPPFVVSSDPANEATGVAIPFVIHVTFSEDIRFEATVDSATFRVYDIDGIQLDGELAYDQETFTVTFTPAEGTVFRPASPYRVILTELIQDKAGNRMTERTTLRFSTILFPDLDRYHDLAAKYSPVLMQSVNKNNPIWDYPTSVDFDGDWDALNNDDNTKTASEIPPAVYYDVIESKTHFFIRYGYFYVRHSEGAELTFGNEAAGALVVVEKYPNERPIAVETYFGAASKEDLRSFVTQESGLVTDGAHPDEDPNGNLNDKDRKYFGVNWVFPQGTLFPAGHYQAYLTTGTHQSCAWVQTNQESLMDFRCELNDGIKNTLSIMQFAYTGTVDVLQPGTSGWPTSTAPGVSVGYELLPVMEHLWTRRDRMETLFSSMFTYEAPTGRMGGNTMKMPTRFVNTMDEAIPGGRPPWAWGWNPTVPDPDFYFKSFNQGTLFIDPAYYFAQRHRLTLTAGNTGFSGAYCFNPYLLLDQRDKDIDCKTTP